MKKYIFYTIGIFLVAMFAFNWFSHGEVGRVNQVEVYIRAPDVPPFQYYLMNEEKTDITLTAPITSGDTVINVSSGHGFTATGEYIVIQEFNSITQAEVIGVAANAITIDSPAFPDYTMNAVVVRGRIDLNIDASSTPQEFIFIAREALVAIDLQAIVISFQHALSTDDTEFGGLAALTNGLLLSRENGLARKIGNFRSHQDFREYGASIDYVDAAPAGKYSTNISLDFKGPYGIIMRFDPNVGEQFTAKISDDLSGLLHFRISLLGQYTISD